MSDPKKKRMKLEEAYDLYGDPLYRYLTAVLGSTEDAEDVLQETFCRFARYSARWRLVRDPKAFAFRCAQQRSSSVSREADIGPDRSKGLPARACLGDSARPGSRDRDEAGRSPGRFAGGAARSGSVEGVRRPDVQGHRLRLRDLDEHGGEPLPLWDGPAAGLFRGKAMSEEKKRIEELLREFTPRPAPPGLKRRVLAAAEANRGARGRFLFARRQWRAAAALGLLMIASLVGDAWFEGRSKRAWRELASGNAIFRTAEAERDRDLIREISGEDRDLERRIISRLDREDGLEASFAT